MSTKQQLTPQEKSRILESYAQLSEIDGIATPRVMRQAISNICFTFLMEQPENMAQLKTDFCDLQRLYNFFNTLEPQ